LFKFNHVLHGHPAVTTETHFRTCPFCEAMCGLAITVRDGAVADVRGDRADPFTQGHVCPKAAALIDMQTDPDRVRTPLIREGTTFREATWEEALDRVADSIAQIKAEHGANATAVYLGNPSAHHWGMATHGPHFLGLLKTRNRYSATSVDQLPHQLVTYLMYGHQNLVPVPDVDRTAWLLVVGANPLASNGSMASMPAAERRLRAIQARGGRIVVVDPRRTETAKMADEHVFVRPGTDAALLLAMARTLIVDGLARPDRLLPMLDGLDELRSQIDAFTPASVEGFTGVPAGTIVRLAHELAAAPRAVVYGRVGVSTQRFGTLAQWAAQVLNILSGNLDRVGGSMFTTPAVDLVEGPASKPGHFGAWRTRVRGLPEWAGELPVSALAEEILTPGDGRVRALVTVAGNPVLSTPNGRALDRALATLDFMVSVDVYRNETTRHAHVILPTPPPLEHDHYDLILASFAVRNYAKYSRAILPKPEGALEDWEVFTELGERLARRLGVEPRPRITPTDVLAAGLALGPHGACRGPEALTFERLRDAEHGVDLGPLVPRLPERLRTPSKRIAMVPPLCVSDLPRLKASLAASTPDLVLIGRRDVRSNNSWMHNYRRLVKGKTRHELLVHPQDLASRGIVDGDRVRVRSRVGEVVVEARACDDVMPGVVSLPHGFGHQGAGVELAVARAQPGVSANDLTDHGDVDVSGTAVLNGVPVEIEPA
jgi:anaerobic selenocysteine-containing dehydrogenase